MNFRTKFGAFLVLFVGILAPTIGAQAKPGDAAQPADKGSKSDPAVKDRMGTPIERELNRALKRSLDKNRRPSSRLYTQRAKTTRISVTHDLSAPYDPRNKNGREQALQILRKELYLKLADECDILSDAFNMSCHMSSVNIRPTKRGQNMAVEVHLTATVTYMLGVDLR